MDWKNRLTAQKSLSQIYWKARKVASSRWNARVAWFVFLVLVLGLGANFYFGKPIVSYVGLVSGINEISEIGFSLTTSILGFLIAGFAIFASITNRDVFVVLAKLDHTEGGISRLQFMFFNFLLVFIHFIVFLAISIFIKLIHYPGGLFTDGLQYLFALEPRSPNYIVVFVFSALAGWLVFLLMLLKSFIWNLYQAVLVTIGAEAELAEQQENRKENA